MTTGMGEVAGGGRVGSAAWRMLLGGVGMLRQGVADLRVRPRGNIPCLDFLRSGAILLVLSAHVGGFFPDASGIARLPFGGSSQMP